MDTNESSIIYAKENGIIDEGSTKASADIINAADAVIFALYPTTFKKWIVENQKHFRPGIFITDVTGVKKDVVYEIQSVLRDDDEFIASHPMAGRETSGVEHSDNKMLSEQTTLLHRLIKILQKELSVVVTLEGFWTLATYQCFHRKNMMR